MCVQERAYVHVRRRKRGCQCWRRCERQAQADRQGCRSRRKINCFTTVTIAVSSSLQSAASC